MLEQSQCAPKRIEPLFYFKFEMRLEFIPFIEQEIREFITFIQEKINKPEHIPQILRIINKRIKDIDRFYDQNWSDYRAQQILRSRQQLVQFCKINHAKLSNRSHLLNSKNGGSPRKQEAGSSSRTKEAKRDSIQSERIQESQVIKKQAINFERVRQSTSKSNERENVQKTPIAKKASPYIVSPILQSPSIPIKSSQSRDKPKDSPIKGMKVKDSPIEKKPAARKMTKEEYILHLRNKKKQ